MTKASMTQCWILLLPLVVTLSNCARDPSGATVAPPTEERKPTSGAPTPAMKETRGVENFIHVPAEFTTIQGAIDAAEDGATIIVTPGIYQENIDFLGKAILLRSEDPEDPEVVARTVIDGGGQGSVVVFRSGETVKTRLDGFTITNGTGSLYRRSEGGRRNVCGTGIFGSGEEERYCGGGILVHGAWPTILNNVIRGNEVTHSGGGIFIADRAFPIVRGNTIMDNTATGGAGISVMYESWPIIEGNHLEGNVAAHPGGGLLVEMGSSPRIERNTIVDNQAGIGAGITVFNHASPLISNNTIKDNESSHSGGALFIGAESEVRIENNLIQGNRATIGGGMFLELEASLTITDNQFIENEAAHAGGAINLPGDVIAIVKGNEFIRNKADQGGAILIEGGERSLVQSNHFEENLARLGGGVFAKGPATIPVLENRFERNEAAEAGGAIWKTADADLRLEPDDENVYQQNIPQDVYVHAP